MSNKKTSKKNQVGQDRHHQQLMTMKKLDNTSLKEEIYQLKEQLTYLVQQKKQIENGMATSGEKYMKESFELEKTIKGQEEQLIELENNQKVLKKTFEETRGKQRREWQVEAEQLIQKKEKERQAQKKSLGEMTEKFNYLSDFKLREKEYKRILNELSEKENANMTSHARDIEKIVKQHEGKRRKMEEKVSQQIETIKEQEVSKIEEQMNRQQQIKRENEIIEEEIALCESERSVLEEEYKQLANQAQGNKGSSTNSLLNGQASQTYQRSLRVIKLENKLTKLKEFLATETNRLENQAKQSQNELVTEKKRLETEITKAEGWIKLKEKDLKKMKACAQMVLNQRSNLEAYLLQVFHQRHELDSKDPGSVNSILRHLFVKINSRKPPRSYKDYLQGSQLSSSILS